MLLRQDNADLRLTDIGRRVGLIGDERYAAFEEKRRLINEEIKRIEKTVVAPSDEVNEYLSSLGSTVIKTGIKLAELLRRPELTYALLERIDPTRIPLPRGVRVSAEIAIKYEGYIKRELAEAERQRRLEGMRLPADMDYTAVGGLRLEAVEKLNKIKPTSIGQASRISGVNPADISVLLIYFNTNK